MEQPRVFGSANGMAQPWDAAARGSKSFGCCTPRLKHPPEKQPQASVKEPDTRSVRFGQTG